jgi:anti-sigma regulatory factor (Ser/Thr protein kinase)
VLELDADKTAPRAARRWLSALLREWSLAQFEESATLIVSELVTNSVAEIGKVTWPADRLPVRLSLHAGPSVVVVVTWDPVVVAPVPREAADDEESGRGLFLMGACSADWGFYYSADIGGKATWAVIRIP